MREAEELRNATEDYFAQPLEENLFEWHFTVRGPSDSPFENGYYHGRIILPTEYPMKPPSIILLTPNGRFETHKKICLSISGHHPETWQPSWSIRTALLAIIGFMPSRGKGAIGSLDFSDEERRSLARESESWVCPTCGPIKKLLKLPSAQGDAGHSGHDQQSLDQQEQRELAKQICFKNNTSASSIDTCTGRQSESESNTQQTQLQQQSVTELRHRPLTTVSDTSTGQLQQQPQQQQQAQQLLDPIGQMDQELVFQSRTQWSTILIVLLVTAISFLIFRRIFLL